MSGFKVGIFTIFFCTALLADQFATTDNGKKVLLQANGSWRFVQDTVATEPIDPDHLSLIEIVKIAKGFDFRKARWGMSKKEVMASEDAKLIKDNESSVDYEVLFLGYNCTVSYSFLKGAFTKATFFIRQPHVDPAMYYNDYENLKAYLTPIYNRPSSDNCAWKNEMYRPDKSKWGFAVSLGFLTCRTEWANDRTQIILTINGNNHQIATNLEYNALAKR